MNAFPMGEVQNPLRRHPRIPFSGRAVVFAKDKSSVSTSVQISEGGILVSTPLNVEIGEAVSVHCTILHCYLRLKGEVIYKINNPMNPKSPRVGIRFQFISLFEKQLIKQLIADETVK